LFKRLRKNGEETPLDHVPKPDFSHNWFMNAYSILSNSCNENGGIPLSELKIYEEKFGLIGSFREFANIIYAISEAYAKARKLEADKELNKI
jgi:hypothetical protein